MIVAIVRTGIAFERKSERLKNEIYRTGTEPKQDARRVEQKYFFVVQKVVNCIIIVQRDADSLDIASIINIATSSCCGGFLEIFI
jgi:hypothetical protein